MSVQCNDFVKKITLRNVILTPKLPPIGYLGISYLGVRFRLKAIPRSSLSFVNNKKLNLKI